MKEFRFRIIIILALGALSLYLLYPTFADYQNTKEIKSELKSIEDSLKQAQPNLSEDDLSNILKREEERIKVSHPSYKKDRDKRLKLGLDLQGGMYLVMEVNTAKLLERLAKDPDETFTRLLKEAEKEASISDEDVVSILASKMQANNIRLSRYFGSIREDDADIIGKLKDQESDAVSRALEIINNRVNQYGVSEPNIQQQGSRRIIVELPGIANEEEAKRLLQGRALLEFRLVKERDFTYPIMTRIDEVLAGDVNDSLSNKDTAADSLDQNLSEEEFAVQHPFFAVALINAQSNTGDAFVKEDDRAKINSYLARPEVQNVIPDNVEFLFSAKPEIVQEGVNYYKMILVNKQPELTGGVIVDAQANIDPQTTAPIVTMQMNSEGAREWARITGSNINKRCAIVLDGVVYSDPYIRSKIPTGNSQIEGMADLDEANLLEIVLKAGALPAPIDIIEERTVGPSLGQDSINQGFSSTILGFAIVVIFMVFYYRKSGAVADFALLFTILFIMGILAGFQAALTLPGIAGIILTIGMAVDANVLIFERIREEISTGKTIKASIESGFSNSYSAIFDSNITTFFTGIILYQFGSGPIQGFALTLMIGIVASLFSALVITRLIIDYMAYKGYKITLG
jgi:preprotein translocase subunit SecD